ncbi:MAG: GNAT family N-acetyltransferase [Acidimicrobiales bacterium]|jgi:ribosomal protein S18 acetylase RimI-like enzyme
MNPVIRSGLVTDVPSVLRLWTEAGAHPSHTDDVASLEALVAHDDGALIVAEDGPAVVGSVIAAWDGWRGSIYRLAVAPTHRRTGLGRQLLHRAEARLGDMGAVRLQAAVVGTDARATGFWRASGWEQQLDRLRFVRG